MKDFVIRKGLFFMIFIASLLVIFQSGIINCNRIKKEKLREIIDINSLSEFEEIIKGRTFVYFYKNNCKTCEDLSDAIKSVEKDHKKVKIAYVNIEENPKINEKYNIKKLPVFALYIHGKRIQTIEKNSKSKSK